MPVRVPWFVWTSLAAVSCILIGVYWDISWHMTIGRDTFWTPAHLAIQAGGMLAGGCGTYVILSTTLNRRAPMREAAVSVWGFRGPLGAFVAVWGAATMLVSAPFDNWWHGAYGLDVKILSPPHVVLTLGILGVAAGGVLTIAAARNRAPAPVLELAMLVIGGEVLLLGMTAILEFTFRQSLHTAQAYKAMCVVAPMGVLGFARVSDRRWAGTTVAGVYTAVMVAGVWLFPLFPATAKLGPVYQPITHFVPLEFPPLVIVPAIACDLVRARCGGWPRWRLALVLGPMFLGVLVAAEWPFASFLVTDAAKSWVFGTHYLAYFMHPDWYEPQGLFFPDPDLLGGFVRALVVAVFASYVGLLAGDVLRRVKR